MKNRSISQQLESESLKNNHGSGFSLLELIVTVTIIATLSAVVIPTYLKTQGEANSKMSRANMLNIKQAFINHFYNSVIDRGKGTFPPEPSDYKMTYQWANNTILYDGQTPAQLFSEGNIIYNPYDHPYLYQLIGQGGVGGPPLPPNSSPDEAHGFVISDPDIGIVLTFIP